MRTDVRKLAWSGMVVLAIWALGALPVARAAEIVIYGFEDGLDGWATPDWAKTSPDYVAKDLAISTDHVEEGAQALKLWADFPGTRWTGAYVEHQVEVTDWTPFGRLSVSVYLPPGAPSGLQGKIILTVGEKWEWTEMNRGIPLTPGKWTALSVNLKPGSMDWKFFPDEQFRRSVQKIGVRVESNKDPVYSGAIFIDNIRLAE